MRTRPSHRLIAIAIALAFPAVFYLGPYHQGPAVASAAKPFNFTEYLTGQWAVEIRHVRPGAPKQEGVDGGFDSENGVTIGNYLLHPKAGGYLEGIYYENITNSPFDVKNSLRVRVDPVSGTAGVFKTARAETDIFEESVDDEPDLQYKTLFEYDFETHKNGMKVSSGEWHGRRKGSYQFAVASASSFLLSVYPRTPESGEATSIQTMTGHKEVVKSMWETYGFQLILVLMIFVPRFFLNSGGRRFAAQKAQAAAGAGPTAAASAKKDK